jgi:glycosyltransferase involved in cell wall biosynthesis
MRVALVATCASPVRQHGADSIESIVWLLGRELDRLGHDVTTFACAGSEVVGRLVETLPGRYAQDGTPADWQLCEWMAVSQAVAQSAGFDLLHSHNYLAGLPLERLCRCPMLHTLHVTPHEDQAILRRTCPDAAVTAISHYQWSKFADLPPAAVVPHGIDVQRFTFRAVPEDYLLYLGRFTPGKGVPAAVEAARRRGERLILAGPENEYFRREVAPHVDGDRVRYVGPVYGQARDRLLGGARALLFPVRDPEPFGLVLAEAMACGTPAAAVAIGAVPEVVEEGVTGACCADPSVLPDAIAQAVRLDRRAVRAACEARFSAGHMAEGYARLYEHVVEAGATPARVGIAGRGRAGR